MTTLIEKLSERGLLRRRAGRGIELAAIMVLFLCAIMRLSCAAQDASIVDQAAATPEVRQKLIAEYQASPTNFTDDRLLAVAVSYARETNYDQARDVYKIFLKDHPDNPRALRGLGIIYLIRGHFREAVDPLDKAWSLGDAGSLQALAAARLELKQYDQVENLLPALRSYMQGDLGIVNCVINYALVKDPPREDLLLEAMNTIPHEQMAAATNTMELVNYAIGRLRVDNENNPTVQAIARKIVRGYLADTNAWPADCLDGVGDALSLMQDYVGAQTVYRRVLADRPDDGRAWAGLGMTELLLGHLPEATADLRKAWSLGQKQVLPYLAGACLSAQDSAGMKDLIPAMLERKGTDTEILNTLLLYSLAQEPPDKALFYQSLEGVYDDQILRRPDTTDVVLKGFKLFGDDKQFERLQQKKAQRSKSAGG